MKTSARKAGAAGTTDVSSELTADAASGYFGTAAELAKRPGVIGKGLKQEFTVPGTPEANQGSNAAQWNRMLTAIGRTQTAAKPANAHADVAKAIGAAAAQAPLHTAATQAASHAAKTAAQTAIAEGKARAATAPAAPGGKPEYNFVIYIDGVETNKVSTHVSQIFSNHQSAVQ